MSMIVSKINPIETPKRVRLWATFGLVNTNARSKGSISSRCTIPMSTSIHIPSTFAFTTNGRVKTKNDYFREMVLEVEQWGIKPAWVTGDSWYSSLENLKFLRNEKVGFLFGIGDNRKVSLERGKLVQVKHLEIPESGLVVYLKEFGWVKVFLSVVQKRTAILHHVPSRLRAIKPVDAG